SEALSAEFQQEAAATRQLLERLPEEKLGWKPHEKSMPLGRLATHIAELPAWTKITLKQDALDVGEFTPTILGSVSEILDLFDKNAAECLETLGGTPDDEYSKTWTMTQDGNEVFSAPKGTVMRSFVMNHIVHHRGQLTVFLRLNDVPLPMTYGPSADETGGF
ncbi:MAG: DinB family protein, partial [Gemmatimonadota bacterium]